MATASEIGSEQRVPLVVKDSKYIPTVATQKLLDDIGGVRSLQLMTSLFYESIFQNPHMEKFFMKTEIRLHADRLAFWVAEKMGGVAESEGFDYCAGGCIPPSAVVTSNEMLSMDDLKLREEDEPSPRPTGKAVYRNNVVPNGIKDCPMWIYRHPWSNEREMLRDVSAGQTLKIPQGRMGFQMHQNFVVHDRSTAHFAGWHCPKREYIKVGDHFKLDDCRIWLRLHFWACRKAGVFPGSDRVPLTSVRNDLDVDEAKLSLVTEDTKKQFQDWYSRFLGRFIRIYENSAPPFVRSESLWSASKANVEQYVSEIEKGSHGMDDVVGVFNAQIALKKLSKEDRNWIHANPDWPYS